MGIPEIVGFVAFVFLLQFGILRLIAWQSGWTTLAAAYPDPPHFEGTRRRFRSLQMSWANYNGGVTVGTNADGLLLAVMFPLSLFHPPIFVPWSEVSATAGKGWFTNYLDFTFEQVPTIRVRFRADLGREIASAANAAWGKDEFADG